MAIRGDKAGAWLDNDLPALQAADLLAEAIANRDPYFNDRDYPLEADHADGANPFARPHPDAPWIFRGLPTASTADAAPALSEPIAHVPLRHDFPLSPDASRVRCRRFVAVDRPGRVA
jgi:hypothetical protein